MQMVLSGVLVIRSFHNGQANPHPMVQVRIFSSQDLLKSLVFDI